MKEKTSRQRRVLSSSRLHVTHVKFEEIHSEGAEPNMFINAAELNVLAKFVEAPKEENVLEAPEITVTAPAAGETSADAVVSSSKEGKHFGKPLQTRL